MRAVEKGTKEYHSFIAAFIGGYIVFGKYDKINEQVRSLVEMYHFLDYKNLKKIKHFLD